MSDFFFITSTPPSEMPSYGAAEEAATVALIFSSAVNSQYLAAV